jgi:DNA-binding GntR family transcriptional regulator
MEKRWQLQKISDLHLLKDKVYEIIKSSIIGLSFLPQMQLVEQRLAEELGVSKSPIRESLLRLEREGLVYTLPFKGCFVVEICEKDIHEIFELREAVEIFCVKHACENFCRDEIQKARKILGEAKAALGRGDVQRCFTHNSNFHDFLVSASGNKWIIQTYANLRSHLDRYRNIGSRILGRVAKSHQEHVLVQRAIEQRAGDRAEKRMSEHLRSVLEDFLRSKEFRSFMNMK